MQKETSRLLKIFVLPVAAVYTIWTIYMIVTDNWQLFLHYFYMSITMVFGSFVAGGSAEGGGAVAFPVMTLIFKIHPADARNFGLAIQSIGMTAATLWIIARKVKTELTYLKLAIPGATVGIIIGSFFIAPYTPAPYAKMLFVSFWLSFGLALWAVNYYRSRKVREHLPALSKPQKAELVGIGLIGGILSAVLGSGVDICTFAFVTMKYNLSEKVATPTSVILMAFNALAGFLLHRFVMNDINPEVYNYWLVCIPVVMLGAPFGALVVSKAKRLHIVNFLIFIICVQFIGAMLIIKPQGELLLFSVASFVAGVVIFFLLTRKSKLKKDIAEPEQVDLTAW
ncbi:MAG TPA: sulfite exporter TauE/SafE family protein [Mucilaginibacter sp.]|nr:sulfite exporter TauE/SafE family protein [Mucilaginibacter sp.]